MVELRMHRQVYFCIVLALFFLVSASFSAVPVAENVTLASSSGSNITSDNLTLSWDAYDDDLDPVLNTTDWRLNGTSISFLNLAFEADGNQNATDYSSFGNNGTAYGPEWSPTGDYDGSGAYEFTAAAAAQDLTKPNIVELRNIHAKVDMQDKTTMSMTAVTGVYDTKAETLKLHSL